MNNLKGHWSKVNQSKTAGTLLMDGECCACELMCAASTLSQIWNSLQCVQSGLGLRMERLVFGIVCVCVCVCVRVCVVGEFGVALGWETGFILFALAADQDDPNHPLLFLSFFHLVSATFCFHYSFYCLSLCMCPVVLLLFHFAAVSLRLIIISLSPSL